MSAPLDDENLDDLLQKMQGLQANLEQANASTSAQIFVGSSGGGKVTVSASGDFVFSGVHIDPSVVDGDAIDLLEDLVLAAIHDAVNQLEGARENAMGNMMTETLSQLFGGANPFDALGTPPASPSSSPDSGEGPER